MGELQNYISSGGTVSSFRTVGIYWKGSSPDASPADACGSDTDPFIANFIKPYLCTNNEFKNPSGGNYRVTTAGSTLSQPGDFSFIQASCADVAITTKYSVRMKLEKVKFVESYRFLHV